MGKTEHNFEDQFEDMTEWCERHPGDREFTCIQCGIYTAGRAKCNECQEEEKTGKFYKWDIKQSRLEHDERFAKAKAQDSIPVLAENQILHLVEIAEKGLPDCYDSFEDFLCDFWPDFSWTPKECIPEIKAVLADPRFKTIVPVLKETWNVDMEEELREGLTFHESHII